MHLAAGFQGIVGMMVNLNAAQVPVSQEAMTKLHEQLGKLRAVIDAAKEEVSREGEVPGAWA